MKRRESNKLKTRKKIAVWPRETSLCMVILMYIKLTCMVCLIFIIIAHAHSYKIFFAIPDSIFCVTSDSNSAIFIHFPFDLYVPGADLEFSENGG